MKFDVIIGNPPYQMNVGVEKENYAIALYDKFVLQAKKSKLQRGSGTYTMSQQDSDKLELNSRASHNSKLLK